ncbi:MAG TPA: RagB/SusD family nutrient uptake outer membrane protein, partial [Anseongella sp.]|nr:RagB/SusD family nutrient uptake outer membrane protein [Anseongella sp.]
MKKKTIIITALWLGLAGCNSMLDVDPHTFSSGENYYETEEQMLRAVNGAYGALQVLYTSDFWAMAEMRADNTNYQYAEADRGAQQREEIDEFLISSTNNYVNTVWARLYTNIHQTNAIISRIDGVAFEDENTKARYAGEAKFLRALHYFHLVRLFGGVPLITEEVTSPSDAFTEERATAEQVYEQIIKDAGEAAESLPAEYASDADLGRATRGAALTLLGEVHLTLKNYEEAVSTLTEVTTLGYSLVDDYPSVFSPANKNNSESVFEVQFDAGLETESSNYIFIFGPRDGKVDLTGFNGTLGGNNIPTPSIVNAYEEGDEREEASIGWYESPTNANYQESQAFGGRLPFIKKFYHPPYALDGRANENWPVYRYAQVLLMLAEAINESGSGDPYQYLNLVRVRAGLDPLAGLAQAQLREAIHHEQRVELAFENHRWYQLLRTGKAMEVMTQHGIEEKERLNRLSPASYNIQEHKLL